MEFILDSIIDSSTMDKFSQLWKDATIYCQSGTLHEDSI